MDLDEWELLPVDGFLDFGDDSEKKGFRRTAAVDSTTVFDVDLDYFRCPSPASKLPPVRFHLDPPVKKDPGVGTESEAAAADQEDAFSPQVFFKKLKENEFVDMKILESPRSGSRPMSPPIENFQFEDKHETTLEAPLSPRMVPERNAATDQEIVKDVNRDGLNIWKWSLTGIGALCSFGVAAATVCMILVIGSHQKNKQNHQKIRFQIYTDDKRIKQVVHHATKLNEAISAARGVPLSRAHITFGGYYEGL